MNILVTYFSAEGTTARVAKEAAEALHADLFEILPREPYTAADLRYVNPLARCNREKITNKDVPVVGSVNHFDQYDTVLIGFPIWYGCAPNVVNTFCKAYDWKNKNVYAFATSGGSGIGKTAERLKPFLRNAASVDAKLVQSGEEAAAWVRG